MAEETKPLTVSRRKTGLFFIKREGGGVVPEQLSGEYNRMRIALNAIEQYEQKRNKPKRSYHKRGSVNGKIKKPTS